MNDDDNDRSTIEGRDAVVVLGGDEVDIDGDVVELSGCDLGKFADQSIDIEFDVSDHAFDGLVGLYEFYERAVEDCRPATPESCPDCDGSGDVALLTSRACCERCDGKGWVWVYADDD